MSEMNNNTTILAVDPGTKSGWCLRKPSGRVLSGVWNLKGGRFEGGGMRYVRFRRLLEEIMASAEVSQVVFEEVRRHMGVDAAHVYGGLIAEITELCEQHKIPYEGIPVGTIKKYATGKGNASKKMMLDAAYSKWPDVEIKDDNQADAMWLAECASMM